ncbi:MAG TPA: hypothetical protein VKG25_06180 [Bryobacteraceae bacterium]|nr:hypothetical protein [Bryobacteraceae bacterium]
MNRLAIKKPVLSENDRIAARLRDAPRDRGTHNHAPRLARYGYPVRPMTTAGPCHMDARMIQNRVETSCTTGARLSPWLAWLTGRAARKNGQVMRHLEAVRQS